MNVLAFAGSRRSEWRWRIVDLQGEMLEESADRFLTLSEALTAGTQRLQARRERDRPAPARVPWHRRR